MTVRSSVLCQQRRAVTADGADQEAVMFGPSLNPQGDRDRRANAQITRAQLRVQGAKLRASVRHWYRRLRGESLRGGPPHS